MRKAIFLTLILITNFQLFAKTNPIADLPNLSPIYLDTNRIAGSYFSGIYNNLFSSLLGKDETTIKKRLDNIFNQLFYGDSKNERLYYTVGTDMGYIEDILHNDIRTEGISYGMMITVQMDKKNEFDKIWKWAKTYMQYKTGPMKNFFAWHCKPEGSIIDSNSASDGEEWIATALFLASARWGNGEGIYNYRAEAHTILDAMLNKENEPANDGRIKNMFNKKEKQIVFVPNIDASGFTDPSYHLPHYYELWARWDKKNSNFWCETASISRKFFKKAANPKTGLFPDYANFDGSPVDPWNGGSNDFRFDAWRVSMNIAIDYMWFGKDDWAVEQSNRMLSFFHQQGVKIHGNQYTLDGKKLGDDHSAGLVAMNAVAALASNLEIKKDFVEELWNTQTPNGLYRYYDGLLYMLGMLQVSGNFKIYDRSDKKEPNCTDK
jgi:oligosaccharide reducing-end xylanase